MVEGIMGEMIIRMIVRMMVRMFARMIMEMSKELSPHDMYACPQLAICHVGSYFGPLVPNFRT
jgi:hypothetical protein